MKFSLIQGDLQICLWRGFSARQTLAECAVPQTQVWILPYRDAHSELNADVTAKHQLIQVSEASLLVKLASLFYVSVRKQGVWPLKIPRGIFTME